jgi:hypothetical protein
MLAAEILVRALLEDDPCAIVGEAVEDQRNVNVAEAGTLIHTKTTVVEVDEPISHEAIACVNVDTIPEEARSIADICPKEVVDIADTVIVIVFEDPCIGSVVEDPVTVNTVPFVTVVQNERLEHHQPDLNGQMRCHGADRNRQLFAISLYIYRWLTSALPHTPGAAEGATARVESAPFCP